MNYPGIILGLGIVLGVLLAMAFSWGRHHERARLAHVCRARADELLKETRITKRLNSLRAAWEMMTYADWMKAPGAEPTNENATKMISVFSDEEIEQIADMDRHARAAKNRTPGEALKVPCRCGGTLVFGLSGELLHHVSASGEVTMGTATTGHESGPSA